MTKINRNCRTLGGYITEREFAKRFLKDRAYSNEWFYTMVKDTGKKYFFVIKEELSELDLKFIEKIAASKSEDTMVYQIVKENDKWLLKSLLIELPIKGIDEFVENEKLQKSEPPISSEKDKKRFDKYIEYLIEEGIYNDIVESVQVEDHFVNRYFKRSMTNIDFVTTNEEGDIITIEVKFKYPTRDKCFGMNQFQYGCYQELIKKGISCYSVVMNNKERKESTDVIDYMGNNEDNSIWYYHALKLNEIVGTRKAAVKTSYGDDKNAQYYFPIPMKYYRAINEKGNFIDLKCPYCDEKMVKRHGEHGWFYSCPNWQKEKALPRNTIALSL